MTYFLRAPRRGTAFARSFSALAIASASLVLAAGCASPTDEDVGASEAALTNEHVLENPPVEATQQDTFYVTFFAYQSGINVANKEDSHTMAQFVRARPDGRGGVSVQPSDIVFISWMPASGVVRAFGPAERGQNTDIDFELGRGARVARARGFAWGPFRVPEAIFTRATKQAALLASGRVAYKASGRDPVSKRSNYLSIDGAEKPEFLNCLAAVGDVSPNGGTIVGASSGRGGTQEIVDHFEPYFVDRPLALRAHDRHRWLSRRLDLGRFDRIFAGGISLEEQRGRNLVAPPIVLPNAKPYASCFCQGRAALDGSVECTIYGQSAAQAGTNQAFVLQSVNTRVYANAGLCASRCAADWTEYGSVCTTTTNTGRP